MRIGKVKYKAIKDFNKILHEKHTLLRTQRHVDYHYASDLHDAKQAWVMHDKARRLPRALDQTERGR